MFSFRNLLVCFSILLLSHSFAFGEKYFAERKEYIELEQAKDLVLKFEFRRARKITSDLREKLLQQCKDKNFLRVYASTYAIDGISYYLEGKIPEAEENIRNAFSLTPDLKQEIESDQTIPEKIKLFVKDIKPYEKKYTVEILSGGDIFVNGEFVCSSPCKSQLNHGINIICSESLCLEKLILREEKTFLPEKKKEFKIAKPIVAGVVSAVFISAAVIIIMKSTQKQSLGLRIILYE
ncbi:MAG: hypothetical protein NZ927_09210 [Candidatus Calescibacterium sp.]|nr:hypothetical protein [Candidatus Calescibacterium sp.]MCX7734137.1 hypothetical protein [bacterium]MDW8087870.1 hypothetical protein [Candidatus Calescibacterium sp.]